MPNPAASPRSPRRVLRLTFAYDGEAITLVEQHFVEMTVPPSHPLAGYEGHAGFWFEVRDRAGTPVYRRILHNPIPAYHEVHAPGASPRHIAAAEQRGVFEILVPASWAGATLLVFATPQPQATPIGKIAAERARSLGPRVGTEAAREIARFNLDEVAR